MRDRIVGDDGSGTGVSESGDNVTTLRYNGIALAAPLGQRLLDMILDAGFDHRHICGGHGFCTSCRVEVVVNPAGLSPVSALESERLGQDAGRLRLACQSLVIGPTEIQVPRPISSRFSPDGD